MFEEPLYTSFCKSLPWIPPHFIASLLPLQCLVRCMHIYHRIRITVAIATPPHPRRSVGPLFSEEGITPIPLSSEYGTYKTVKAIFWPCLVGKSPENSGVAPSSLGRGLSPPPPAERIDMGTSLERKRTPLGPYRRPMPRVLGGSWGGGRVLLGEVPLYGVVKRLSPAVAQNASHSFRAVLKVLHWPPQRSNVTALAPPLM